MLSIEAIASDHGILIIEDVAQAFGAKHHGRNAGTIGFCGCFSFYPTKNLAALGDAGMVVTNDETTADLVRRLRNHGTENNYEHSSLGINSRLDSLQAAAISVRLRYVEEWTERRRKIAEQYLTGLDGVIVLPTIDEANHPVFNQFVVRTSARDALKDYLKKHGIGTKIYYPIPLHLQQGLAPMTGEVGDYPCAEEVSRTCLALPIFPELSDEEVNHVINKVREFHS